MRRPVRVLVLNQEAHRELLVRSCANLPVELVLHDFPVPWAEVAARRAGNWQDVPEPLPTEALRSELARAEVLFAFAPPRRTAELAPHLRWVETPATGYDQLNGTGVLEAPGVRVTTVGGLFAASVAEHAWALILALLRRLPLFLEAQRGRRWEQAPVGELRGRTLGIVGYGNIGRAVARMARGFGMRVLATRSSRPGEEENVDEFFARHDLHVLLARSDIVVVTVRGEPANDALFGAREFAVMRDGAWFINVARGSVVDEQALCEALRSGKLAGAGLDVFRKEPLPADHRLWAMPNVVLTPHVAMHVPDRMERCVQHFCQNLRRYCAAEPLLDEVPFTQRTVEAKL